MTERYSGFVVVLDEDRREDDSEAIIQAIRQLKGVLKVEPVVSDPAIHIAHQSSQGRNGRTHLESHS